MVDGDTYEDCIFGLGYVHGRDRLWNLHFMRMLSSGRLAEVKIFIKLNSFLAKIC